MLRKYGTVRHLGMAVANQNLIKDEIKRRLNLGNGCYHSVQKLLSSHLMSKNVYIRVHKTIILPVVLYGCETWCDIMAGCLRTGC
jgi:uncharacterized protein YqgQ